LQAEDGIRHRNVTGVQTCALPIFMIRAYKENDIDILIDIWYKSSLQAHDFIYSGYWESQIEEMKEKYIPMSETHVITNQTKIIGFISMVEGYLAALFIDVAY